MARISLDIQEAGLEIETIDLRNVPVGRAPSSDKDCGDSLPCTWESGDSKVTVTITDAEHLKTVSPNSSSRYLNYRTEVTTSEDMKLMRDRMLSNSMITNTGQSLDNIGGIRFGTEGSYFADSEYDALAGVSVETGGRFPNPDTEATKLERLQMSLFESARVQRYDPVFTNIPVAPERVINN